MRLFVTTAGLSVALALALATNAPAMSAQDKAPSARTETATIYRSLTAVELKDVLDRQGYKSVNKQNETDFVITTTSGFQFRALLMTCDIEGEPSGCLGLMLRAAWSIETGDEVKIIPVVQDFNNRFRIGKALIEEDSVYLERYAITDGGVTLDHIGEEVDEFLGSADALQSNMFDALK